MTSLLLAVALLSPGEPNTVRKLSVKNVPQEKRQDYAKATSFVLNSLSRERKITKAKLEGDYIKFDLDDYGINPKVFDGLKHPYKEMRADWFINNVFVAPNYYKFLGVSDLEGFKKLVSHTPKGRNFEIQEAGMVSQSSVARNNRKLMRTPTVQGFVWTTYDVTKTDDERDYLRNLLSDKYDSLESLGTLPNGLLVYFAGDNNGKALDYVDPLIATDKNFNDRLIRVGRSCVICHTKGVQPFDDTVRRLTRDVELKTDKETAKRLGNTFGTNIKESVRRDQRAYAKSVRTLGMNPYTASKLIKNVYLEYEKPVTLEVAAAEVGISQKRLLEVCRNSNDPRLLGLAFNRPIERIRWEELHNTVLDLASK